MKSYASLVSSPAPLVSVFSVVIWLFVVWYLEDLNHDYQIGIVEIYLVGLPYQGHQCIDALLPIKIYQESKNRRRKQKKKRRRRKGEERKGKEKKRME